MDFLFCHYTEDRRTLSDITVITPVTIKEFDIVIATFENENILNTYCTDFKVKI